MPTHFHLSSALALHSPLADLGAFSAQEVSSPYPCLKPRPKPGLALHGQTPQGRWALHSTASHRLQKEILAGSGGCWGVCPLQPLSPRTEQGSPPCALLRLQPWKDPAPCWSAGSAWQECPLVRTQSSPSPLCTRDPKPDPQASDKVPSPWTICTDRAGDAFGNSKREEGQGVVALKVVLCLEKIPVI